MGFRVKTNKTPNFSVLWGFKLPLFGGDELPRTEQEHVHCFSWKKESWDSLVAF